MAKRKDSEFGSDHPTFRNSDQANFKQSEKLFNVIYRNNSSMEIQIGREFIRFEANIMNPVSPAKFKTGLPQSIINHSDFQKVKSYFVITEKSGG